MVVLLCTSTLDRHSKRMKVLHDGEIKAEGEHPPMSVAKKSEE